MISSWTRRQGNISSVFASLSLLDSLRKLTDFLNKSEHKDAINRKTTPATVLTWVNQLREVEIKEN